MKISRRKVMTVAAAAALATAPASEARAGRVKTTRGPRPASDGAYWTRPNGSERIAMVLYPGMTALDLIGPQYFFGSMRGAHVELVAKTKDLVKCDRNITLQPTASFADVNGPHDLIFVPGGGLGTLDAMDDDETLAWLRSNSASARYIGSVCSGVLILGAAGLLEGYRATGHWKVRDACLPALGATPVDERFVIDRNRVTAAGVTAGIDFGLNMTNLFRGPDYARALQLIAEYDPQPLFNSGNPHTAWPETTRLVTGLLPEYNARAIEIAKRRRQT